MHPGIMMETKKKPIQALKTLKKVSSTEKKCNKCGFVTFCLRVLYKHRYKCQGRLLGSLVCCYCKRKFNYLSLFKQHKNVCVKYHRRKKILASKIPKELIIKKLKKSSKQVIHSSKPSATACPVCLEIFSSKQLYDVHVKKGFCKSKKPFKRQNFSARKSFSKMQHESEEPKADVFLSTLEDLVLDGNLSYSMAVKEKSINDSFCFDVDIFCMWCKNIYPTKEILQKHLMRNSECAAAYYRHESNMSLVKNSFKARKSFGAKQTVVARKSFSRINHKSISTFNYYFSGGSARKSLPGSQKRFSRTAKAFLHSPAKVFNQCPVCYKTFPDSFNFFRHQKKFNHWGKATKSMSNICKCPFCEKQFHHVRSRNAHLRNHADKSEKEIEFFLRNTTCNICSQIFVSETAKFQHIKIKHTKSLSNFESRENHSYKQSLLPSVIKQKLKEYPNTCPICSKKFPSNFYCNKHLQTKHLDSELECQFCSLRYNSVEDLEYHMQRAHYNSFKFECLVCKIKLATAPQVVLHVTKVHSDQDPKKIIRCRAKDSTSLSDQNIIVSSRNNLDKGSRSKPTDLYCDICNLSFLRLCGLQSHRQSKSHRDNLVKNLDVMHKSLSDSPVLPPPVQKKKVKRPEILTCSDCFEEFTSVKDFVPHRLSHFSVHGKYLKISEQNCYICEICGEKSNSHSKVQLHLFWHLQVESTAIKKNSVNDKSKNDPIVPDRLSGQHVAKKSFVKQNSDSQQEVVIGGVKKPLFTCELCNIGFTTQAHYSLHVRKFCRMKNASLKNNSKEAKVDEDLSANENLPGINSLKKQSINSKNSNLEHCTICNCLYSLTIQETHKSFCEKCTANDIEIYKGIDEINSNTDLESMVGACISCSIPFDKSCTFSDHMLACHKSAANSVCVNDADKNCKTTVYCTTCNCLIFHSEALENHNTFCNNTSYNDIDSDSIADILKAISKFENPIAACIACSVAFGSIKDFKEHMISHYEIGSLNSSNSNKEEQSILNVSQNDGNDINNVNNSFDNLEHISSEVDEVHKIAISSETELNSPNSLPNDSSWILNDSSNSGEDCKPIDTLRENFSQLLCILINDPELMDHLGFGKQPVDDVLTKALTQMGQKPVLKDEQTSDIDCLRKNIHILLDFCLKDQIMELIGSGKTSIDDIVVEALKMFSVENNNTTVVIE
ncbi:hypothetical protein CDAR_623272 [Caerostris darwini]|uniref:C2H2-type domain-containing protein n=1 Tax=Caerostris darwini TaxID=1538125 RepID=A0AAV4UIN6_9ARAC|nr:hypothetical protein CDAR_623272 [Caerostris darwini]